MRGFARPPRAGHHEDRTVDLVGIGSECRRRLAAAHYIARRRNPVLGQPVQVSVHVPEGVGGRDASDREHLDDPHRRAREGADPRFDDRHCRVGDVTSVDDRHRRRRVCPRRRDVRSDDEDWAPNASKHLFDRCVE